MKKDNDKEKYSDWHKDPANWILGIFYFNREDKRIFPQKRFKELGWTVNFAHPASIFVFVLVLFIILIISWLF